MIEELPEQHFSKVLSNLSTGPHQHPEALSVLSGSNPGKVYVDSFSAPRSALIWAQGIEGFYLVGDAESRIFSTHLDEFVQRVIKPEAKKSGLEWFEVSGDSPLWDRTIQRAFNSHGIESSQQYIYNLEYDGSVVGRLKDLNLESVHKINSSLLHDSRIRNSEFFLSKIKLAWRSFEEFLDTGIGYVVLRNSLATSVCFSSFVAEKVHVLDVETIPDKRCQGFAKIAAGAFLLECLDSGMHPYWDCMDENTASRKLAESLGFKKQRKYNLHYFEFDRKNQS